MGCLKLQDSFIRNGFDYDWFTGINESLVTRARNACVDAFLNEPDYQRLEYMMFIDADIGFEPDDVARLWNLQAPVSVAAYAMKSPNKPKLSAWVNGRLVGNLGRFKKPIEVDYAGTGFMMISRNCIEQMCAIYDDTKHCEGAEQKERYALFDTEIVTDPRTGIRFYASEDYLFCHRWRKMGGKILMDPSIRLKHWGAYAFEGK